MSYDYRCKACKDQGAYMVNGELRLCPCGEPYKDKRISELEAEVERLRDKLLICATRFERDSIDWQDAADDCRTWAGPKDAE